MNSQDLKPRSTVALKAKRLVRVVVWCTAIAASLLTFPDGIGWMMAAWIGWLGLEMFRQTYIGGTARFSLLVCLIVILIKQPGWSPALIVFLIVGLLLTICLTIQQSLRTLLILYSMLCLVLVWYAFDRRSDSRCSQPRSLVSDRPVVCLGDSLTDGGYPRVLSKMLSIPVVDFGRNGYTTEDAIKNLIPEIEALQPQVAIVELGGHDFKNGRSRGDTERNLITIIERLQAAGAVVILVEIPRGFISDPYAGLERELCGRYDLQLIPDTLIRRFVFFSPIIPPGSWLDKESWLSNDGLHPNQRGNQLFAEYAKEALIKLFGSEVLDDSLRQKD